MQTWQIHKAKTRFSEVVECAEHKGPQEITRHGKPVAVVLSIAAFERLSRNECSLVEFVRRSPLYGLEEVEFGCDRSLS